MTAPASLATDLIESAVLQVAGVSALHRGLETSATSGSTSPAGRSIALGPDDLRIQVVGVQGYDLRQVAGEIVTAVAPHLGDYAGVVRVHFEDLAAPSDSPTPRRNP